MKDLALHVLDVTNNSVSARATLIQVAMDEQPAPEINMLTLTIEDNGRGMDADTLRRVTDPFYTTRTTRKVGLGLPLLKQNAEKSGGAFEIWSEPGRGTRLRATFRYDNIDRPPRGDMAGVMTILCTGNPHVDFVYTHTVGEHSMSFDTREIKAELEGTPINHPHVVKFIGEMFAENLEEITNQA